MTLKGIDVSKWQGTINWPAVKAAGIQFAIIKAGGSDKGFYKDPQFEANYAGARNAGIHVGAYYFVGPGCTSRADGLADAKRFVAQLAGKQFDFPVYIDFEAPTAANPAGNTDACIAFCEWMEAVGYYVGIYASDYSGFADKLEKKRLLPWTWWVAHYGAEVDYAIENKGIWQYTSDGSVSGINGRVDMDEGYIDYSGTIISGGYNGYNKDSKPAQPSAPAQPAASPATSGFAVGDTVVPTVLKDVYGNSLKQWDNAYTITALNGNNATLSARGQVWAVLPTSNIRKVGSAPAQVAVPQPSSSITVGCNVRLRNGAKTYTGGSLASFVYGRVHQVSEIKGDRAVITYGGQVVAAVHVSDLTRA